MEISAVSHRRARSTNDEFSVRSVVNWIWFTPRNVQHKLTGLISGIISARDWSCKRFHHRDCKHGDLHNLEKGSKRHAVTKGS